MATGTPDDIIADLASPLALERAGRECADGTVSLGHLRPSAPLRSGTSSDQLASTGSTRAVGESGSTV